MYAIKSATTNTSAIPICLNKIWYSGKTTALQTLDTEERNPPNTSLIKWENDRKTKDHHTYQFEVKACAFNQVFVTSKMDLLDKKRSVHRIE